MTEEWRERQIDCAMRRHTRYLVFAELVGVWVFAAYWLIKRKEITESDVDRRIARGELYCEKDGTIKSRSKCEDQDE